MDATDRIAPEVIWEMRSAIAEADGAEVVFACDVDADGTVDSATAVARGVEDMVAAPVANLRRGAVVVHNHPSGALQPSRADVLVAADLSTSGVGSYIVNNDVTELVVVCEPDIAPVREPLDADALASMLDSGGALSELFPDYEPRSSQIEMLEAVADAFNDDAILAVEAGTGVGKSFAYLLPAVRWAATNDERVVVSTATINLQQQLVDKDIPTVKRLLATDVPVVLVKGRGNYLCTKRLFELRDEASLFAGDDAPEAGASDPGASDEVLETLVEWSRTTDTGSRSELPFVVPDEVWSDVNSDADHCSDQTCRLREACFFQRARREAAAARVLIVNHHLLFIDLALRVRGIGFDTRAILPPFQRLIFDEAHSIETSATSLFSDSFSVRAVRKHTRRLRHDRGGRSAGILQRVRRRGVDPQTVAAVVGRIAETEEAADALNAVAVDRIAELTFRFTPASDADLVASLLGAMRELRSRLIGLTNAIGDLLDDDDGDEQGPFQDLKLVLRRLERLSTLTESFDDMPNHTDRVFWIEIRRSGGARVARFVSSPLDISDVMRAAVFDVFDTSVFTSATLTVGGSFGFWSGRIGLADLPRGCRFLGLPSPYDYRTNSLLAVPVDAPEPGDAEYLQFLERFLSQLLSISEGRALVLFTSYEMLRATSEAVRDRLAQAGIATLRQGDDDRARLLARFVEDRSSVLFATESFWQGVDAPGDTLQVVVLCRLPFRVPTDPVLMARTEAIEARGGNAFAELALPDAVMKLRQGFGRLIRRSTDRGVVVVTDVRFVNRSYGALFASSLPETDRSFAPAAQVLEDVERFLYP